MRPKFFQCLIDGLRATFRSGEFDGDHSALCILALQFALKSVRGFGVAVYDDRDRSLSRAAMHNGRSNSLGAASDDDYFFLQFANPCTSLAG